MCHRQERRCDIECHDKINTTTSTSIFSHRPDTNKVRSVTINISAKQESNRQNQPCCTDRREHSMCCHCDHTCQSLLTGTAQEQAVAAHLSSWDFQSRQTQEWCRHKPRSHWPPTQWAENVIQGTREIMHLAWQLFLWAPPHWPYYPTGLNLQAAKYTCTSDWAQENRMPGKEQKWSRHILCFGLCRETGPTAKICKLQRFCKSMFQSNSRQSHA